MPMQMNKIPIMMFMRCKNFSDKCLLILCENRHIPACEAKVLTNAAAKKRNKSDAW